jgi:cellulose synthase/poly-beta-1,6-N-acetylglucosamine synthase-like glycosyltransferase
MATYFLYAAFFLLFAYISFCVFYLFFLSLAGKLFYRERNVLLPGGAFNRIAVLVPGYKEDEIIVSTAGNMLQLDYPADSVDVYIIADSFNKDTLDALRRLPVEVLEVSFDKSTKAKSLNEAFRRIEKAYDIAVICDADNIPARDFLKRVNMAFCGGTRAVQGRRVAKNLDSPFAILDACSEGINNNIFRRGADALGLSSPVIGSGMAFEYGTIRRILAEIDAVGGFDKIMQLKVVQQGIRIRYLAQALIFDEKVSSSQAFKQQRRRWISSQFIYLRQFFLPGFRELFRGNLSYFNLAVINNLVLPRAFLLLILPLTAAAAFFAGAGWGLAAVILLLLHLLTLAISVPAELINKDLGRALLSLPKAIFVMAGTLLHLKKANKTFIHTLHTKTEVSNSLFNEK